MLCEYYERRIGLSDIGVAKRFQFNWGSEGTDYR